MEDIQTKEYYNLKEISMLVSLKYRHIEDRIKEVKEKYGDESKLIFKKSNKWFIHNSVIKDFQRKRWPIKYQLFVTIGCKNDNDLDYWKFLIKHLKAIIKGMDSTARIKYVLEKTQRQLIHLHVMTTYEDKNKLKKILKSDIYLGSENGMNVYFQEVYNVKGLHNYFRKQNKPVLLK